MQRLALPADRQEKIDEISRSIMRSFQREYLAEYSGMLVAKIKSDVEATDGLLAGSQSLNKLQDRTAARVGADVPLYGGWLTKLGAVRKNWKRRWFAISPDYTVAYYANERDRQPRGSMMMQGYEVRPDCFKGEKDFCIELHHRSRRCFYVYADSREDYEQWIPILKEVCRKSRFRMHPDPLRARAFDAAFKSTQRTMEDDTDRMPELSEREALVQLICDRIDAVVLSDTDFFADSGQIRSATAASGLHLSRRFASFTSKKLVLATVLSVVGATLQAVHETADHLRRRLKPDLRSVWPEFTRLEDELNERIEEVR